MRTVEITPSNKDCNSKQKLMSSYCILLNISHTSAWKSEASPVSLTLQPYVIFWPFWQQLLLFLWNSGNSIQESLFSILKVLAAQFGTPFVICSPLALISDFITRDFVLFPSRTYFVLFSKKNLFCGYVIMFKLPFSYMPDCVLPCREYFTGPLWYILLLMHVSVVLINFKFDFGYYAICST